MPDQSSLNSLLQWSIENSANPNGNTPTNTTQSSNANRGLDQKMLAELLGGPSDADLMRAAMTHILAPFEEVSLEHKLVAWDNLEQLIEQIDNANNVYSMGMWPPLIAQLDHEESEMRRMAAWCCSTAVQNNDKAQEKFLAEGGVPKLAKLAQEDQVPAVQKKAISALSSAVRNYQPAMDALVKILPEGKGVDAGDMAAVDEVIAYLRAGIRSA